MIGGGNKWRTAHLYPTGQYSEIDLSASETTGKVTAAFGYMSCGAARVPCLRDGERAHVRLVQSGNNINQWNNIEDDVLGGGVLLHDRMFTLSMSPYSNVIAVGIPGSNASGSSHSGQVQIRRFL